MAGLELGVESILDPQIAQTTGAARSHARRLGIAHPHTSLWLRVRRREWGWGQLPVRRASEVDLAEVGGCLCSVPFTATLNVSMLLS